MSGLSQEEAFRNGEADAWVRRNPDIATAASADDPVLAALARQSLPSAGALLDAGGAAGRLGAGFLRDHPGWQVRVVDPSSEAIAIGARAFPSIGFEVGTLSEPLSAAATANGLYDVVAIVGVLCWIDRARLSRVVANTDAVLADGGLLVLSDYDAPFPRANAYAHRAGLFTYKQNYAACYTALGIYHLLEHRSFVYDSSANPDDPYDRQWMTAVLRKDLTGRFARSK
jgi:SAM-dependent methyltransferase